MKYYPSRRNSDIGFGWLDDSFEDFFKPFYGVQSMPSMKTDIQEKDGQYLLEVDMPGYDKKDISLSLEKGYLTISAQSSGDAEQKDEGKNYIRRERHYGSCSRSFYVGDIDEKDISAKYDNGILNISFPKNSKQQDSSKHIEIR